MLPQDLVTDQALADADGDVFHHAAIAKAVGDLALSSATPVNVALFGPWGAGKSTFYNLLRKRVHQQDPTVAVVRYDAWKYGGQDLKRNFIQDTARQLHLRRSRDLDQELTQSQERTRLSLWRWCRTNALSILGAFVLGVIVATGWTAMHAWIVSRWVEEDLAFREAWPRYVNEFGIVLAAILTGLLLGPKAVESAVLKTVRPAAERDDQFGRLFSRLVRRVKASGAERLVVFIDELDRCEPDDVVATLVDLKTFLDHPDCVFIVAADRDVLEDALQRVPQAKPIRQDQPYYSTPGAFLDKIFQHQIALPPLRAHALSSFAHRLVGETPQGLWRDLRAADPDGHLFDDVVYILVPAHITSPRRVKVLLNNFATSARIAESRHIDWISRARELALLTVLETEFPSVAAALVRFPRLLTYLRDNAPIDDLEVDRQALIRKFASTDVPGGVNLPGSVSGELLGDARDAPDIGKQIAAQAEFARRELARQLREYLEKLAVVPQLDDPRPDLFYLRVVGFDDGITDPVLGEMIDLAAERRPEHVVAAFANEPQPIKLAAVRLLIHTLANERGTGQANVLEASCRLIQEVDAEHIGLIAHRAPDVLQHLGKPTWRPNALPGAVRLAAIARADAEVEALLERLNPAAEADRQLLLACLPAMDWMSEPACRSTSAVIAASLQYDHSPLAIVLSESAADTATRCWLALADEVERSYETKTTVPPGTLFAAVTTALLSRAKPHSALLWKVLFHAQRTGNPDLLDAITERHEPLTSALNEEDRLCAALHQIELGNPADWPTWLPYADQWPDEPSERISEFARDAALAVIKTCDTSSPDPTPVFTSLTRLLSPADNETVLDAIHDAMDGLTWADPSDPKAERRATLNSLAALAIRTPAQQEAHATTRLEALVASVAGKLPAMKAGSPPVALFDEWRSEVASLPTRQAQLFDQVQAKIVAPSAPMKVEHLRLRVAARLAYEGVALSPTVITTLVGQPNVELLASEWLALTPKAENAAKVHSAIPLGTAALGRYAACLSLSQRTTLWIALESDGAQLNLPSSAH